jgi:hypothetical protein
VKGPAGRSGGPLALIAAAALAFAGPAQGKPKRAEPGPPASYEFNDSHFHLTNYVQEGTDVRDFLKIMGGRVGRSTLFGIPLQQTWSTRVAEGAEPTYYLDTDAPLYYYSFTDAFIAESFLKLSRAERARFDPSITGFNPADMYAADHVRRVLSVYPCVFDAIGEFSIHKEFVSSKVAGVGASLTDPALDRLLDFAGEVGLVVILHNDIATPFIKPDQTPAYFDQTVALFRRHPNTTIIWAHTGLGRVVRPPTGHVKYLEKILADPALKHVNFDISWDEVAKYATSIEGAPVAADLIDRYPDRFLFGTDTVAPKDAASYFRVFDLYKPLLDRLTPEARDKLLKRNYERLFDEGRRRTRAWEAKALGAKCPA